MAVGTTGHVCGWKLFVHLTHIKSQAVFLGSYSLFSFWKLARSAESRFLDTQRIVDDWKMLTTTNCALVDFVKWKSRLATKLGPAGSQKVFSLFCTFRGLTDERKMFSYPCLLKIETFSVTWERRRTVILKTMIIPNFIRFKVTRKQKLKASREIRLWTFSANFFLEPSSILFRQINEFARKRFVPCAILNY